MNDQDDEREIDADDIAKVVEIVEQRVGAAALTEYALRREEEMFDRVVREPLEIPAKAETWQAARSACRILRGALDLPEADVIEDAWCISLRRTVGDLETAGDPRASWARRLLSAAEHRVRAPGQVNPEPDEWEPAPDPDETLANDIERDEQDQDAPEPPADGDPFAHWYQGRTFRDWPREW